MSKHRNINPLDSVDLALLLESFDESIGTLYPQARVFDPGGSEITGSPFDLTLLAAGTNLYVKKGAFQADVDSGTYEVLYLVYTDAGHTVVSATHGQQMETITVKIQSTTGLGSKSIGGGGNVYLDNDEVLKEIKKIFDVIEAVKKENKEIKEKIDEGFTVSIPENLNDNLASKIDSVRSFISGSNGNVISYLKDNLPKLGAIQNDVKEIANINANLRNSNSLILTVQKSVSAIADKIEETALDSSYKDKLTSFINKEITTATKEIIIKENSKLLVSAIESIAEIANSLNNRVKDNLKYTLGIMKMLVGKSNTVNIKMQKDE